MSNDKWKMIRSLPLAVLYRVSDSISWRTGEGRQRGPMPDKTRTVVVIESHQQTIVRRSRRTVSGQVLTARAVARPRGPQPGSPVGVGRLGRASSDAPEPAVLEKPKR